MATTEDTVLVRQRSKIHYMILAAWALILLGSGSGATAAGTAPEPLVDLLKLTLGWLAMAVIVWHVSTSIVVRSGARRIEIRHLWLPWLRRAASVDDVVGIHQRVFPILGGRDSSVIRVRTRTLGTIGLHFDRADHADAAFTELLSALGRAGVEVASSVERVTDPVVELGSPRGWLAGAAVLVLGVFAGVFYRIEALAWTCGIAALMASLLWMGAAWRMRSRRVLRGVFAGVGFGAALCSVAYLAVVLRG